LFVGAAKNRGCDATGIGHKETVKCFLDYRVWTAAFFSSGTERARRRNDAIRAIY
jgi:hypothetical protein